MPIPTTDDESDDDFDQDSDEIPPDTVVSLTPQGHLFLQQLLESLSAEAGRPISADDVHDILQRVKAETGKKSVDFKDKGDMECFIRHLRALRMQ